MTGAGHHAALGDLVAAELIDQTAFSPHPEYAFRHPLVRAVAYESQLKSDRAQLHRRVAAAIDQDDQNAALIAEHYEAAGELRAAYDGTCGPARGRSTVTTPRLNSAGSGRCRWPTPCLPMSPTYWLIG